MDDVNEDELTLDNFKKNLKYLCEQILFARGKILNSWYYDSNKLNIDKYNKYCIKLFDYYGQITNDIFDKKKSLNELANIYYSERKHLNSLLKTYLKDINSSNNIDHIISENYQFKNAKLEQFYNEYDKIFKIDNNNYSILYFLNKIYNILNNIEDDADDDKKDNMNDNISTSATSAQSAVPSSQSQKRTRTDTNDKEEKKETKKKPEDFTEFDFVKKFYEGNDEYKTDDLFRSLTIADSVHDNETRQASVSRIIRLFYEQPNLQLSSNVEYNILEEAQFIKYITEFHKNLSKTGNTDIIDFVDNNSLINKFYKDIRKPKYVIELNKTIDKITYPYYPISIIDELRKAYTDSFGEDNHIIGNLVDAIGVKMDHIFYNTIKNTNDNYIEITEETSKWDMATKKKNEFQLDKYCDCERDFYYTKNTSEEEYCKKITDTITTINNSEVYNTINTFMNTNTIKIKINNKDKDTSIKNTVAKKEIDCLEIFGKDCDTNNISINYNILSFNLVKNKNDFKLHEFIEVDKSWNIYEKTKSILDYTPYKFISNKSWTDLINKKDFKYIHIPTISNVNFYITSDKNDNCNSYIFFIRNTNSVILRVNSSKRGQGWNEFNISFITDIFIDLLLNNNNIIIGEFVYFAKLLGYKLTTIDDNDTDYISKTYYDKNDGTIALKYEVDKDNNDIIKPYTYDDYINYLNLDTNNTEQFKINGKLGLLKDDNIFYIKSNQVNSTHVIIPVTKISNEDINDFIKLLLDLKRSGDWSQVHSVYYYNYKTDDTYKKSIGIKKMVFTTFDRLASLYARILDVPHIFHNKKKNTFEFYKPLLEDKKSTTKRARIVTQPVTQSVTQSINLTFFKQDSLFCGKETLNNLLCNIDFIRYHFDKGDNPLNPLIIHDINNIKITWHKETTKFRFIYFYNDQLNLFAVALNHLLNLGDITIETKIKNKPVGIKFKDPLNNTDVTITYNETLLPPLQINNDNKQQLNRLLENKQICNIYQGDYANFIIKSALCKINNDIYNKNKNKNNNFILDSFTIYYNKDNSIDEIFSDNIVSNNDTLGYNILFSSASSNAGHWISILYCNDNDSYILFNSLENKEQSPVDKLQIIDKLKSYYNNSNIIIYKLTKTSDKNNEYLKLDEVLNKVEVKRYYNTTIPPKLSNISEIVQIDITTDIPETPTDNYYKIDINQITDINNILDDILQIINNIIENSFIEDLNVIQLKDSIIKLKDEINEQYSIAQSKASTENHYYYRGLIKMASRLIISYKTTIEGIMYSIKLFMGQLNDDNLNKKYSELEGNLNNFNKYIDKTIKENIKFIEKGQNTKLSNENMLGGSANLENNTYTFYIFEDLYYSLYDTDINMMIPIIYSNCSKLVNFYLEYINKFANNNLYDIILLLLDIKQDILDAIERNDFNIINILQDACSCLSLYNDSAILTLDNITAKLVNISQIIPVTIKQNIDNIFDNEIQLKKTIENSPYSDKIINMMSAISNSSSYFELKSQSALGTSTKLKLPSELGSTERIAAPVAGGSRASQLYIEYFMKNSHKIKKEDKKNIRNILKEEKFEDDLTDFIKSHLKL